MENFFNRQVERLEFTTRRMEKRAALKKDMDAQKLEEKVCVYILSACMDNMISGHL